MRLYIKVGKRIGLTIRHLGYLTKNALKSWHHEYEQRLDLPAVYVRPPRYSQAHKVGSKSPAGAQLDGLSTLAVDAQGRIHIASRVMPTDHQSRARGSGEIGVMRVDEAQGSVLAVTGAKLPAWGHDQTLALDGPAERATFKKMQGMCFAPEGTLYVLDELTVRRIDRQGQVSTWVY